jgi:hypothetical protein
MDLFMEKGAKIPEKLIDFEELENFRKEMEAELKKDGIPICIYCKKKMTPWTPKKGKFKGQEQKHSFICNCEKSKGIVLNVG